MADQYAGKRLRGFRKRQKLSQEKAAYGAMTVDPALELSRGSIERWERGMVPETSWDPWVIRALAIVYGVRTEDLSPFAAQELERMHGLLCADQKGVA